MGVLEQDLQAALQLVATPKTLEEIDLDGLSNRERERVLDEAFQMITADRQGGAGERNFLRQLISRLGFSPEEGKALLLKAATR
jgi:hypothetical protein